MNARFTRGSETHAYGSNFTSGERQAAWQAANGKRVLAHRWTPIHTDLAKI